MNDRFISGIASGVLAALIWAAFPVITKLTLNAQASLSAFDITALRFAVAGVILLPFLLKNFPPNIPRTAIALMVMGAGAPYLLVVAVGLNYAPAGHFGMLTPSTMLLCTTLMSWKFFGERLRTAQWLGIATILTGILLIGWQSLILSTADTLTGDALFILGGVMWATFTITSKRIGISPLHSTALVAVLSMLLYVPYYLIFHQLALLIEYPQETLLQAVYQGVFSAVIALLLYSRAVNILGAAKGAVFGAMVPGTALLLAIPILNEVPTMLEMLGVTQVMIGMLLALGIIKKTKATILKV